MTLSNNFNAILKTLIVIVIVMTVMMTPVFAHTLPESHGLINNLLHPLFSLDHVSARLLMGSVIVFLAYMIANTSQYQLEKLFGVGFAVSGIVMMFNL